MKQITLRVDDEQTITALLDYLAELEHIHDVDVVEVNGANGSMNSHPHNFYQDPRSHLMDQEIAAFERQKPDLLSQYPAQFVALFQGRVVDHDADKVALLDRIDKAYPDDVVLVRQVREKPRPPFRLGSPRLMRG